MRIYQKIGNLPYIRIDEFVYYFLQQQWKICFFILGKKETQIKKDDFRNSVEGEREKLIRIIPRKNVAILHQRMLDSFDLFSFRWAHRYLFIARCHCHCSIDPVTNFSHLSIIKCQWAVKWSIFRWQFFVRFVPWHHEWIAIKIINDFAIAGSSSSTRTQIYKCYVITSGRCTFLRFYNYDKVFMLRHCFIYSIVWGGEKKGRLFGEWEEKEIPRPKWNYWCWTTADFRRVTINKKQTFRPPEPWHRTHLLVSPVKM